ncbi:MAG: aldo/keto reductase [Treponema sp.]|jgi:L-galactose dehydrogenase|nr:aldo/keto reductase [Treponema sp.]
METVVFGRTGLKVTIAGLGCGGFSQLGLKKHGLDHAANIVKTAYDAGVNYFDTATIYGTQGAVGKGLSGIKRDSYFISTKFPYNMKKPAEFMPTLEESLRELKTDYIDVYLIHGVMPKDYAFVVETYVPLLKEAQKQGKIRFLGTSETFGNDTSHEMYKNTLKNDDYFDVAMIGYNLLNPSAAKSLFPLTLEKNIGVLDMFAVRTALSNPAQLLADISHILEKGQADPSLAKKENPLDFLTEKGTAETIMEAAYRFCRHTKGVHVVLTGTGSREHLLTNLKSIQGPKLPDEVLERLENMFGRVDCVSGQPHMPM